MEQLTPNAIFTIYNKEISGDSYHPVVQVFDIKQIGVNKSSQERIRLVLSDGEHIHQAIVATQLNELVNAGQIQKWSLVRLIEFICNNVNGRKIVIVLNLEVVSTVGSQIGNPVPLLSSGNQPPPTQNQPVPPTNPVIQNSGARSPNQNQIGYNSSNKTSYEGLAQARPSNFQTSANRDWNDEPKNRPFQGQAGGQSFGAYGNNPYNSGMAKREPPPRYSGQGSVVKNENAPRIVPIRAINPYMGRWTIKARVTSKSDVRRYNNAKGEGKVFSFDLLDSDGGEIRATCFNKELEKYFDLIEAGRVYMVSKGQLRQAQKQYNHLDNEWEVVLDSSSTVEECSDDGTIKSQSLKLRPIASIEREEVNSILDIIGVVTSVAPVSTISRKNGTETQKRTCFLRDNSNCQVELTLWGAFCTKEGQKLQEFVDSGQFPVLVVKSGRVGEFNGKHLGTIGNTQLMLNPDIKEAHELKNWFNSEGNNATFTSLSREGMGQREGGGGGGRNENRKFVGAIKEENLGRSGNPDYISVRGTIAFVKNESFCYQACPNLIGERPCQKKVTVDSLTGKFHCERCSQDFEDCDYRYILNLQVQDHTGVVWVTAFQESAEEILGVSARNLYRMKQDQDPRAVAAFLSVTFTKRVFRLKVKEESWQDEQRVKSTILKSEPLDFVAESKLLLSYIEKLEKGEPLSAPLVNSEVQTAGGFSGFSGSLFSWPGGLNIISGAQISPPLFFLSFFFLFFLLKADPVKAEGIHGGNYGGGGGGGGGGYGGSGGKGYGGGFTGGYGGSSGNQSSVCYKCNQSGHFAKDCPNGGGGSFGGGNYGGYSGGMGGSNMGGTGGGGGGGGGGNCFKCGEAGHWSRDCPNAGRGGGGMGGPGSGGGYGRSGGFGGGGNMGGGNKWGGQSGYRGGGGY